MSPADVPSRQPVHLEQSGVLEVRDSHKDTVISGQAQKESIIGGIVILLNPAPIIDPFPTWKRLKIRIVSSRGLWVL